MQAVRFVGVGRPPEIHDIPKPTPGPGQVLIKIGGAGVCHSDLHVMEEDFGFVPPFTLGHENAGSPPRTTKRSAQRPQVDRELSPPAQEGSRRDQL